MLSFLTLVIAATISPPPSDGLPPPRAVIAAKASAGPCKCPCGSPICWCASNGGCPAKKTADAAPTPMAEVNRVINLLPKPAVGFVDFGCGLDARVCVAAAERWPDVKVTGVEIDPARADSARTRIRELGLDNRVTIIEGDASDVIVKADVGYCYLYSETLSRMKPKLELLTALASYQHQVPGLPMTKNGDSWIYRKTATVPVQSGSRGAVWGGMIYRGPVCNSPGCAMCNAIRRSLSAGGR